MNATQADTGPVPVSLLVHTRNSARTLPRLLATTGWAAERIVVDMQSADDTVALARAAGARILDCAPHPRVDDVRNDYLDAAGQDWTFVLDSDEYLADDAGELVRNLIAQGGDRYRAVWIPRFNRIGRRILRASGWYPDHQLRLFARGAVRWTGGQHRAPEVLVPAEQVLRLHPPGCLHIHHDNYRDLTDFVLRQAHYAAQEVYDTDPTAYDYRSYIAAAYAEFAARHDREQDGDDATALATLMAWDRLVRGILHWDRLDPQPPLGDAFALPVCASWVSAGERAELETLRDEAARLRAQVEDLDRRWKILTRTRWYRAIRGVEQRCPALIARVTGWIDRLARRSATSAPRTD